MTSLASLWKVVLQLLVWVTYCHFARNNICCVNSFQLFPLYATIRHFNRLRMISHESTHSISSQVNPLDPEQFHAILTNKYSRNRNLYQILDVREKNELLRCSIKDNDVINLPLSELDQWQQSNERKGLLDPTAPTICLCKMGGRSQKVASFLGIRSMILCRILDCYYVIINIRFSILQ